MFIWRLKDGKGDIFWAAKNENQTIINLSDLSYLGCAFS
jgi:hypothetical protein